MSNFEKKGLKEQILWNDNEKLLKLNTPIFFIILHNKKKTKHFIASSKKKSITKIVNKNNFKKISGTKKLLGYHIYSVFF